MAKTIHKDRIIERWTQIIANGAGNMSKVYTLTNENLKDANLPNVTWKRDDVSTGLFGATRNFILVRHNNLREYELFISARDFGKHLDCGWYLTCKPGLFKRAVSRYASGNQNALSLNLDVFDQQDLYAWTSCVHHAFLASIEDLMRELEQDISSLNKQSKGYLAVW